MKDAESIHALAYFNLLKTGSWIEERIKVALKPFNLTHAQLNVLHMLMSNDPNPVSASDIKNGILVSNPDITRLMDRLVRKGCIHREICPVNRRKMDISLTDEGRKLFNQAYRAAVQAVGNYFDDKISEDEAVELRRILHKIVK